MKGPAVFLAQFMGDAAPDVSVAALAVYASLNPPRLGMAILGLVIAYNLLLPIWAKAARSPKVLQNVPF